MNAFKKDLHERALLTAQKFKRAEAELIQILQEVDQALLFLDFGKTSLYQYAVDLMELPESIALCFINVSRKAGKLPALQEAILDGIVSVSKVKKVASVLTLENQKEWIGKIMTSTSKELEREVARINPREAVHEQTKYVSENRLELKMGISQEMLDQLKRVQDLESKRTAKAVGFEEALQELLRFYLEKRDPQRKAERVLQGSIPVKRLSQSGKTIPALEKHQVTLRDRGQCTEVVNGKRCENKRWTEVHHIVPRAVGGAHSLENLTTLCSVHHKMIHRMESHT